MRALPPSPVRAVDTLSEPLENYSFISVPPQVQFTSVHNWTKHTVKNLVCH